MTKEQHLALAFAAAWGRVERRLDHSLGAIRGISLAEYRLLHALGSAPNAQASRVDLAQAVGLTPSGVTRALRPMEKLGVVSTVKSKRDARLAIAVFQSCGQCGSCAPVAEEPQPLCRGDAKCFVVPPEHIDERGNLLPAGG